MSCDRTQEVVATQDTSNMPIVGGHVIQIVIELENVQNSNNNRVLLVKGSTTAANCIQTGTVRNVSQLEEQTNVLNRTKGRSFVQALTGANEEIVALE